MRKTDHTLFMQCKYDRHLQREDTQKEKKDVTKENIFKNNSSKKKTRMYAFTLIFPYFI